jgi:hypothetical protein
MSENTGFFDKNSEVLSEKKWKEDTQQQQKALERNMTPNNDNSEKHALFQSFTFWFVRKQGGISKATRFEAYEQGIQCLTTFSTVCHLSSFFSYFM